MMRSFAVFLFVVSVGCGGTDLGSVDAALDAGALDGRADAGCAEAVDAGSGCGASGQFCCACAVCDEGLVCNLGLDPTVAENTCFVP